MYFNRSNTRNVFAIYNAIVDDVRNYVRITNTKTKVEKIDISGFSFYNSTVVSVRGTSVISTRIRSAITIIRETGVRVVSTSPNRFRLSPLPPLNFPRNEVSGQYYNVPKSTNNLYRTNAT